MKYHKSAEWLEWDGLGGFASATVTGRRTRGYHALLLIATAPPGGRVILVNGFDAAVETGAGTYWISSQHYLPDVIAPNGADYLEDFSPDPWPRWTYRLGDGTVVEQELFMPHGHAIVVLRWKLMDANGSAMLRARPFLSGRDYHALHRENPVLRFGAEVNPDRIAWHLYEGVPRITAFTNGRYDHDPVWYRNFFYETERERGLPDTEDLASPGVFSWDLDGSEAIWIMAAGGHEGAVATWGKTPTESFAHIREREAIRRQTFQSGLHRAADAYIVDGRHGRTIVAGYPWFTDWGRDTFIALRGLCLASGRLDDARDILVSWANAVDEGMLPNLFPDQGEAPRFNSVDASLWYIIACHDFFRAMRAAGRKVRQKDYKALVRAIQEILEGYTDGTRYRIHCDRDGLLAAGQPGVQLTWMDAKINDWVVTPRIGKPVEVEALWLNALWVGGRFHPRWKMLLAQGMKSFEKRFWNPAGNCLYDVVDCDHRTDTYDESLRPNQILAVGGLPLQLVQGDRARQIVAAVEASLLTPIGLRSLKPGAPGYVPYYAGGVGPRDAAYHQGTVWPWLLGPFVEAWLRVRGNTAEARRQAKDRFLPPLLRHLEEAGIGHISEIADGDAPHQPRGCPFQAWSVGEVLRLITVVLAEEITPRGAVSSIAATERD